MKHFARFKGQIGAATDVESTRTVHNRLLYVLDTFAHYD